MMTNEIIEVGTTTDKAAPVDGLVMRDYVMDVHLPGARIKRPSGLPNGSLALPDGVTVDGGLTKFGENDLYVHCIIKGSGAYYGVYKDHDNPNHFYSHLRKINECALGA